MSSWRVANIVQAEEYIRTSKKIPVPSWLSFAPASALPDSINISPVHALNPAQNPAHYGRIFFSAVLNLCLFDYVSPGSSTAGRPPAPHLIALNPDGKGDYWQPLIPSNCGTGNRSRIKVLLKSTVPLPD